MERHISEHLNIVGYLHIGYGVLYLLIALIVFVALVGGGWISGDAGVLAITSGVAVIVGIVMLVLAAPSILGGWGVLNRRDWGRILIILLSILDLFSFPIGTAIGVYSLWVLSRDEARRAFH